MQHSSVVMGHAPMTPEMWLDIEPIPHRCHTRLCATIILVALVPRSGGLEGWFFADLGFIEERCIKQPVARKVVHCNLFGVVPHAHAEWWRICHLPLRAQCRQSFVVAVGQHSVAG